MIRLYISLFRKHINENYHKQLLEVLDYFPPREMYEELANWLEAQVRR